MPDNPRVTSMRRLDSCESSSLADALGGVELYVTDRWCLCPSWALLLDAAPSGLFERALAAKKIQKAGERIPYSDDYLDALLIEAKCESRPMELAAYAVCPGYEAEPVALLRNALAKGMISAYFWNFFTSSGFEVWGNKQTDIYIHSVRLLGFDARPAVQYCIVRRKKPVGVISPAFLRGEYKTAKAALEAADVVLNAFPSLTEEESKCTT